MERLSPILWTLAIITMATWVGVEVQSYHDNKIFQTEVMEFMKPGDRFTADDGRALEKRIKDLEDAISE